LATEFGHDLVVSLLASKGGKVDSPDCQGRMPLHWAAMKGRMKWLSVDPDRRGSPYSEVDNVAVAADTLINRIPVNILLFL